MTDSRSSWWRSPARIPVAGAAVLDAVLIVVFAAVGRASHGESNPVLDALGTAWPFLTGAAAGWVLVLLLRRVAPLSVATGWPVWLLTVAVGMVLRAATGRGVAVSFVIVATVVLALFLLGWRLLAGWLATLRR
ncbi:DUF3054 domain-containing protein [Nakamurella aerolata]|uniref:DUF3054 domain-containing protein n=1 Tax=Nakamurella aerolata TaxID=1656892 RepID=UPI0031B59546